ncbi:MAG: adenine nucleotide alpha hydrolase [Puia sp.]|nr:adenine nucleotide alpha hydrolase [Puia sp.]
MNNPGKTYMNWSGGKDSALCLHRVLQENSHDVGCLLTSINTHHDRISMHGVRRELLEAQATAMNYPLETVELSEQPDMKEYEHAMNTRISSLRARGYSKALFGDIFLEDLKRYREQQLAAHGIECLFPLWKESTIALVREFIGLGFKAIIVCVNEKYLDRSFCGRLIDETFLADLPANADPCGENGEYHSFVFEGPVLKYPIPFQKGDIVRRQYADPGNTAGHDSLNGDLGFFFADLLPVQ